VVEIDFDPFAKVSKTSAPKQAPVAIEPLITSPTPVKEALDSDAQLFESKPLDRTITDGNGNPVIAYVGNPSVPDEVRESATQVNRAVAPVIDPVVVNRNPRFSPPSK
jgi:hypothetical protein